MVSFSVPKNKSPYISPFQSTHVGEKADALAVSAPSMISTPPILELTASNGLPSPTFSENFPVPSFSKYVKASPFDITTSKSPSSSTSAIAVPIFELVISAIPSSLAGIHLKALSP